MKCWNFETFEHALVHVNHTVHYIERDAAGARANIFWSTEAGFGARAFIFWSFEPDLD